MKVIAKKAVGRVKLVAPKPAPLMSAAEFALLFGARFVAEIPPGSNPGEVGKRLREIGAGAPV